MNAQEREKAIQKNMKYLKMSREQAEQVVAGEEEIDKGFIPDWAVETKEQKANRRKVTQTTSTKKKPMALKGKPKEKKIDETKQEIVNLLNQAILNHGCENVEIVNVDRVVAFELNGEKYEITLTKKRKPKGE